MPFNLRAFVIPASRALVAGSRIAQPARAAASHVGVPSTHSSATFFTTAPQCVPPESSNDNEKRIQIFAGRIFFLVNSPHPKNNPKKHVENAFSDYKREDFSTVLFRIPADNEAGFVAGNALHYVAAVGANPEVLTWLLQTAGFKNEIDTTTQFNGKEMTALEIIASRVADLPKETSSRLLEMKQILEREGASISSSSRNYRSIQANHLMG